MKAADYRYLAGIMEEIDFFALIAQIEAKRLALGVTEADDDACRNGGSWRTAEKRQMLQEIADRCKLAGIEPLKANF